MDDWQETEPSSGPVTNTSHAASEDNDSWKNTGGESGGFRGRGRGDDSGEKDASEAERPRVTYVPPSLAEDEDSVFAHYEKGINFDKYDDIMVDISGTNPPEAIVTFDEAKLCESLRKNITKSGYAKPTPVQKHGIPIISAGRDLMACAQTGSGKTAAFLLPILQQLMAEGVAASRFSELQEPEAIIVAPTRELICQIYLEARKFAFGYDVDYASDKGSLNTAMAQQNVCEMMIEMVGLQKVRYFVLDEADRMLDMGFEPDMRRVVGSPGMPSKENRQTLMFSATYPEDIQSDREQRERELALMDFRSGKCPVLIATSVAARGLDIPDVQHVVNFDLPNNIDEYVHRIGRTGRCGNTGRAVSFFDPDADGQLAQSLVTILSKAQQVVPPWLEEYAFSGPSSSDVKSSFASTDSRKGGSFQDNTVKRQVAAAPAADEEEWE
ncbi:hypothetical protein F2P81_002193 [Scophthalmus maximus]|uniref:RNA helicase n=1 Tax=Scophthalmus maximus TaxID=52904 RepID=A0A6A4TR07_SCOMX|nr:hypothetical protein F2P81_002193 [Scophthalmus maximus]